MINLIGCGIMLLFLIIGAYIFVKNTKSKKAWRVRGHETVAFKSMYEAIRYAKLVGVAEEEGAVYYG